MAHPASLIDVHHHARPVGYIDALAKLGITAVGGRSIPQWQREPTLELMDRHGIATAILSSPDTESAFRDLALARSMSRRINEMYAGLIADAPARFGGFASLPLPHVDDALAEMAYALDVLKLDGVLLSSNHAGIYPGDPRFDPVLEELDRRRAVVFVHPASPVNAGATGLDLPGWLVEFVADTTRCISNLIARDVPGRFPNIRFIFSHAGGAAPYIAFRLASYGVMRDPAGQAPFADAERASASALRSFYFDSALSAGSATIRLLMEVAGPDKVLFGSDHPQVPAGVLAATVDGYLAASEREPDGERILRANAEALFPRLRCAVQPAR
jgi:predicted TIM-barrel fold metal-dependent hydrolase